MSNTTKTQKQGPETQKPAGSENQKQVSCWKRLYNALFESKEGKEDKWVTPMKGSLGLTASIIATLTFQLATNPPGGVVQASLNDKERCSNSTGVRMCAGEAVMAVLHKKIYLAFLICDTISFLASLHVCILLVSGIPLKGRFLIWLLSMGMWVSVTNLALAYLFAASMVTSSSIWPTVVGSWIGVAVVVWVSVIVISSGYIIVFPPFLKKDAVAEPKDAVVGSKDAVVGPNV